MAHVLRHTGLSLLGFALSACGSVERKGADDGSNRTIELVKTVEVVPGTMFATIDANTAYADMQSAAKSACKSEAICKVILFPVGTVLPTKFPMTDREVTAEIGNYTLNRNTGADELIADCKVVKDTPKQYCS